MDAFWTQARADLVQYLNATDPRFAEPGKWTGPQDAAQVASEGATPALERLAVSVATDGSPRLFFVGRIDHNLALVAATDQMLHVSSVDAVRVYPTKDLRVVSVGGVLSGEMRMECHGESLLLSVSKPVSMISTLRYFLLTGETPPLLDSSESPVRFAEPIAGARGTLFSADPMLRPTSVDLLLLDTGHVVAQEILGIAQVRGKYLLEKDYMSEDLYLTSTAALNYSTGMTERELGRAAAGLVAAGPLGLLTVAVGSHLLGQHAAKGIRGDRPVLLVSTGQKLSEIVFSDRAFADQLASQRISNAARRPMDTTEHLSIIKYFGSRDEALRRDDESRMPAAVAAPAPWVPGAGTSPQAVSTTKPAPWQSADQVARKEPHAPALLMGLGGFAPLVGPGLALLIVLFNGAWHAWWTIPAAFVNGLVAFGFVANNSGWKPESRVPKGLVVATVLLCYGWWGWISPN